MLATGCGEKMITLTDEEADIIALYSAKMVAKFNKNQEIGICNAYVTDEELGKTSASKEETLVPQQEEEAVSEDGLITIPDSDTYEIEAETGHTLTEAFGIDGLEFYMNNLMVTDEYVATDFYVMAASEGMQYCIVTFDVLNSSGSDVRVDMLGSGMSYSLTINGIYSSTAQTTVLENDLTTFQGTIKQGTKESMVIVFQFKEKELEQDINNIDFVVQSNGVAKGASL